MKKWFTGVTSIEELRKKYRELLRTHHPDNGGNVADMQSINAEYDALFDVLRRKEQADQQYIPKKKTSDLRRL